MHRELFCKINLNQYPLVHHNLPTNTRVINIDPADVNESVRQLLLTVNIRIDCPGWLYCSPEYTTLHCHVDGDGDVCRYNNDWHSLCKLNYVIGGPNVTSCWYDVPADMIKDVKKIFTSTGFPFWIFDVSKCTAIESEVMQGWYLFDAGVPHNIVNHRSEHRWNATLILRDTETNEWLTYNETKKRMQSLGLC